jgi:hypothetical protein
MNQKSNEEEEEEEEKEFESDGNFFNCSILP